MKSNKIHINRSWRICICEKKLVNGGKMTSLETWKYGSILVIQKNLIIIKLWFLKKKP
jgi:hypothetical protein